MLKNLLDYLPSANCATPSRSLDDHCSAGCLYRCAWRARSRRPGTHATCERRIDAKACSDEAVVVEVDRCIDENQLQTNIILLYYWLVDSPSIFYPQIARSIFLLSRVFQSDRFKTKFSDFFGDQIAFKHDIFKVIIFVTEST